MSNLWNTFKRVGLLTNNGRGICGLLWFMVDWLIFVCCNAFCENTPQEITALEINTKLLLIYHAIIIILIIVEVVAGVWIKCKFFMRCEKYFHGLFSWKPTGNYGVNAAINFVFIHYPFISLELLVLKSSITQNLLRIQNTTTVWDRNNAIGIPSWIPQHPLLRRDPLNEWWCSSVKSNKEKKTLTLSHKELLVRWNFFFRKHPPDRNDWHK